MLQAFISVTIVDNTIFYPVFFESFQRRGEPEQLYPTGTPISNCSSRRALWLPSGDAKLGFLSATPHDSASDDQLVACRRTKKR